MNKTSFKEIYLAAFFYLACTVAFFYPIFSVFSQSLIGPPEDNMQFYWFLWYGVKAILSPAIPFMKTNFIYYPEGESLYYANYFYYGIFLATILKPFLNLAQIFNLMVLHSFVVAGIGAFLLIRDITKNFFVSLIGGFIFAFNPSHFAHALHHVTISSIQFIPFFVWMCKKSFEEGKWSSILLAALFLTLNALCDWNYLIYGFIFMAGYYVIFAFSRRNFFSGHALKSSFFILLISGVFLSPLIVPMLLEGLQNKSILDLPGHDLFVADLFGFFTPSIFHLLGNQSWVLEANTKMTGPDWEKVAYLGWVNLALVLFIAVKAFKENKHLLIALLFFMVIALGVHVHVLGQSLPFYMPYKILEELPFFTNARNPARVMMFAYLILAVLVARAFLKIKKKPIIFILFALIFVDFYSLNQASTPVELPKGYGPILNDPDEFAVIELPWDKGRYMLYQTLYDKPSVQGYLGRKSEKSLIGRLHFGLKELPIQKRELTENKVKYILLFKKRLEWKASDFRDLAYVHSFQKVSDVYSMLYPKVYEDDGLSVFKVY